MDYLDYKSLEERYTANFDILKHRSCKAGSFVVYYTPISLGKSWIEKANQLYMASRFGGKTSLAFSGYIIDDFKAWMPRTKLLQSKSKQRRMVRVVVK